MPPPAEGLVSRIVLGPALRTQPDGRLVTLVREGYELAFDEIVRRYRRPLGRYAAAIVGGHFEDVTQDAFSKALLAMRRDDSQIELRPWLYRIVRNTALNELRDRPAAAEELAETIAGGRTPSEAAEQREELADLMNRLQALPEAQRAAIVMRELEGLGHDEIAAALGLSGPAARQAIYRGRQALRDGVGMLVPLPLLKALLAGGGGGAAEAAAGATGVGGAAGAGIALKATAATVLVAGAVGAGVAIDHSHHSGGARAPRASAGSAVARRSPGEASTIAGKTPGRLTAERGATAGRAGNEASAANPTAPASGPGQDGVSAGGSSPAPQAPHQRPVGERGGGDGSPGGGAGSPARVGDGHGGHSGQGSGGEDTSSEQSQGPDDSRSGGGSGGETTSGEGSASETSGSNDGEAQDATTSDDGASDGGTAASSGSDGTGDGTGDPETNLAGGEHPSSTTTNWTNVGS